MATTKKETPKTISGYDLFQVLQLALASNTTYATGTFGSSLNIAKNLTRITKDPDSWNGQHKDQIYADAEKGDCFAFDCIGLVKSAGWWGWSADPSKTYGGAKYEDGMPDVSVHAFFRDYCDERKKISSVDEVPILTFCGLNDWSHIAVSVGGNLVIEATRYGTHRVRLARIKGKTVSARKYMDLPERAFDFYAYCKYVDLTDLWKVTDATGKIDVIKAWTDMRAPILITKIETK